MSTQLPLMSLRGHPIFPGNQIVIDVGRPFTIASIKEAVKNHDGRIVVVAQKSIEMNDKSDMSQLFPVGAVCKILNCREFPDGMMKIQVMSLERIALANVFDSEGVRYGKGDVLANSFGEDQKFVDQKSKILEAINTAFANEKSESLLQSIEEMKTCADSYQFVSKACHLLAFWPANRKELTLRQMNEGVFLIDSLSANEKASINLNVARVQEIMEERSFGNALNKIAALMP
jgi:ATP-dependent Lon protease